MVDPDPFSTPTTPTALQAEQRLLGAILADVTALTRLPTAFTSDTLVDPLHALIFREMLRQVGAGQTPTVTSLNATIATDLEEIGGANYLRTLHPPEPEHAQALVQTWVEQIQNAWHCRVALDIGEELAALGKEIVTTAFNSGGKGLVGRATLENVAAILREQMALIQTVLGADGGAL